MSKALTRGMRIAMTRPSDRSGAMAALLWELDVESVELPGRFSTPGCRRPLARSAGDITDPALPRGLMDEGAQVVDVMVFRTLSPPQLRKEALRVLEEGVDMGGFISASTVRNLATALGSDVSRLNAIPAAVIGPVTARAARETGLSVAVEAEDASIPGLVAAIRRWRTQREDGHGN